MCEHFFIIGAQRSGTSYLYRALDEHPEIDMARPMRPEPKFFLKPNEVSRGSAFYLEKYFVGSARTKGEKSTSYIESDVVPKRISEMFADARIIVVLREPVSRAISNYWFSRNNGLETLPLWEALSREGGVDEVYDWERFSVSPFAYLRRGRYIEQLRAWARVFRRSQMHILLFENLVTKPEAIRAIYEFLGVHSEWDPTLSKEVVNPSKVDFAQELRSDQVRSLRRYYEDANAELAAEFDLDLSCWR